MANSTTHHGAGRDSLVDFGRITVRVRIGFRIARLCHLVAGRFTGTLTRFRFDSLRISFLSG
ncbi:MAG TPA: hypothetical protein DER64_11900, partial [Planctomycetaceae bacterium]|nr:hypothetical protein [Planctomycetaceae bacterium]